MYETIIKENIKLSLEDLEVAIDLIHFTYPKVKLWDYETVATLIFREFDIECTKEEVWEYYETLYQRESEDIRLICKHAGYYY